MQTDQALLSICCLQIISTDISITTICNIPLNIDSLDSIMEHLFTLENLSVPTNILKLCGVLEVRLKSWKFRKSVKYLKNWVYVPYITQKTLT